MDCGFPFRRLTNFRRPGTDPKTVGRSCRGLERDFRRQPSLPGGR